MYNTKDLIVTVGNSETGDQTIDVLGTYQKTGWELVLHNNSGNAIVCTVEGVPVYIPIGGVMNEAFLPFESFVVSGSSGGAWSWYMRSRI